MLYIVMCVYYFKIIILNMYCIYIVFIASKAVLIDMEVPVISVFQYFKYSYLFSNCFKVWQ